MRFFWIWAVLVSVTSGLAWADGPMDCRFSATLMVAVPHPSLGLDWRASELFSVGLAGGGFSLKIPRAATPVTVGIANLEARGRWHPWQGSFFLGVILGGQTLSGTGRTDVPVGTEVIPVEVAVKINSPFVTPHLGWFWIFGGGFTFGIEAGLQVPVASRASFETTILQPELNGFLTQVEQTAAWASLQSKLDEAAKPIGLLKFPHVAIRLGWSF